MRIENKLPTYIKVIYAPFKKIPLFGETSKLECNADVVILPY